MNPATLEAREARTKLPAPTPPPALTGREVTAAVFAALLREARADASRHPHDAFVSIRFDAGGRITIASRFTGLHFTSTDDLAEWLVARCKPEAAPAGASAA